MTMDVFFQSGHVAFVMLAVMVLELWLLRRYLRHMPIIAAGLGAGACLVLALRSALLDHGWPVISIFLIMSFGFHLLEIQQCLRLARRLQY
jgi:hypothetical protein